MAEIQTFKDIEWVLNEEENVYIAYPTNHTFEKMDFIYAMLKPGQELKLHYHERPNNGDEVFLFPYEGKICLKTIEKGKIKENEYTILNDDPLSIKFKNKEPHGLKNIGLENLRFTAIYTPAFIPGEVKYHDPLNI